MLTHHNKMENSNHYEYLCKYNKHATLPAIAFRECDQCCDYLCPMCGFVQKEGNIDYHYCNECYRALER